MALQIPNLSTAFQALGNALKVPGAASFTSAAGMAVPKMSQPSPMLPARNMTPLPSRPLQFNGKPVVPNVPAAPKPNMTPVPPGQTSLQQNMTPMPPNMSTPLGPMYGGMSSPNIPKPTFTAPAPAPAVPTTQPSQPTAPPATGAINPATGGVAPASNPAPQSFAIQNDAPQIGSNTGNQSSSFNYSASAGGSPAVPAVGTSMADTAYKAYLDSLKPSDEETEAQERLNRLNVAAETAYTNTQNQPIALPFITGQQAALQRSQSLLARPLESQIALAQSRRQASGTISKAMMEREDKLRSENKPVEVGAGGALIDPRTGKEIYRAPAASDTKAPTTMETEAGILQWDGQKWVTTGFSGTKAADKKAAAQASAQAAQARAAGVEAKITDALGSINNLTTGPVGALSKNIPGTGAYNLERTIDVIKANLGFQELAAMRAQSPTGGALGNVTEKELQFLQSTVASLDIGQSPEQLKKNLEEIRTHFNNWKNAVVQAAQESGAGGTSGSSGSLYDF